MNKTKVLIITVIFITGSVFGIFAMQHDTPILDTMCTRSGQAVIIKPIVDNFSEHEPLFRVVYAGLYAQYPSVMVDRIKQFSSINVIARLAYEQDKKEFDAHEPTAYFIHAIIDGKPVGYLSFTLQPDGSVYADKLLIDPAYQGMGIAKHLANAIFILVPQATKVNLITHRSNLMAVNMYKQHGCVEIPIPATQAWADPKSWVGLEFTRK